MPADSSGMRSRATGRASATTISARFCRPGTKKVAAVARTMPKPAQRMPAFAVAGELMRFKPRMKRIEASR